MAETWVINRDHSVINFEVPYLKLSSVQGKFNNFTGRLEYKDNKVGFVEIIIRSETIDTGIRLRDTHLRSNDFLATKKYPETIFRSDKISKRNDQYTAQGILEIKNKKIPLVISFGLTDSIEDTWNKLSKFVNFSGSLNKKDLEINWNKTLPNGSYLLGEEIKISGSFQLQPKGNLTASSKHKMSDNKYLRNREQFKRGETQKLLKPAEQGIKTLPNIAENTIFNAPKAETKNYISYEPDWFAYTSFTISFIFGLLGSIGICYLLFRKFELQKWHDSEFIDDSLKHSVYLLIVGGYVFFTSFLFPLAS